MDLTLNNQQWLICHKTKSNQATDYYVSVVRHLANKLFIWKVCVKR